MCDRISDCALTFSLKFQVFFICLLSSCSGHKRGRSPTVKVVVPELLSELCSSRVLVMEWIEGTKLTDIECCGDRQTEVRENLAVVKKAIECTLSQFLETSLLHADPHTG